MTTLLPSHRKLKICPITHPELQGSVMMQAEHRSHASLLGQTVAVEMKFYITIV